MRAMASSKPTLLLLEGGLATAPPRSSPVLSAAARCPISTRTDAGAGCRRREVALSLSLSLPLLLFPAASSWAASEDEEYVRETTEVIGRVRATVNMEKGDPKAAGAVAELREASNTWVAKYRREKALLGRASFRDMYSALNAISGHYISFGPTAPIPAKRKARILEELDTAEKALQRGR